MKTTTCLQFDNKTIIDFLNIGSIELTWSHDVSIHVKYDNKIYRATMGLGFFKEVGKSEIVSSDLEEKLKKEYFRDDSNTWNITDISLYLSIFSNSKIQLAKTHIDNFKYDNSVDSEKYKKDKEQLLLNKGQLMSQDIMDMKHEYITKLLKDTQDLSILNIDKN
jgi:hypothetical protein